MDASVTIQGTTQMFMHSIQMLNPMNPIKRMLDAKLKELNKAKGNEALILEVQRLEWFGGLYYDEKLGPYIPAINVESCIRDGAKSTKNGKDVTRHLVILDDRIPLQYKGPRGVDELWEAGTFFDVRGAKVGKGSKVNRCRPLFPADWSLTFTVRFSEQKFNNEQVIGFIKIAGAEVGLGDYRPRFGKFEMLEFKEI